MKWTQCGFYMESRLGHLFVYVEDLENDGPSRFEWFIAPDDEDKNYRRAIMSGAAATHEEAEAVILAAAERLIEAMRAAF